MFPVCVGSVGRTVESVNDYICYIETFAHKIFLSAAGGQDFLGEKLNIRGIFITLAAVEGIVFIYVA